MIKIAINQSYGGFGLPEEAFEALLIRKGVKYEQEDQNFYIANKDHTDENIIDRWNFIYDRSDPDLIAVIEELRQKAPEDYSTIGIVEIPDDVKWHIEEYDGFEHVAEDHRTWF